MAVVIGVVGPPETVDTVALHCGDRDDLDVLRFDYADEAEAPAIVAAHTTDVDGWLFTGIGPYTRSQEAEVIDRPAVYVPYTREALQHALIRMLRTGRPIDTFSVDTMSVNAVNRCLRQSDIDRTHVRILPYRRDLEPADYAAFHRRAQHGRNGTTSAVTCLTPVHELIEPELDCILLRPTRHAIRNTLQHLMMDLEQQARGEGQIALGLVDLASDLSTLTREVRGLQGYVGARPDGVFVVVTTRGRLAEVTADFTAFPIFERLLAQSPEVHIGFGIGFTAAEAEHLARRALIRARRRGPAAAVLSRRNDSDVVLAEAARGVEPSRLTVDDLARRSGIAAATLQSIRALDIGDAHVTPADLARRLGLQARSARRVLSKLESAGLAERAGEERAGIRGRPSVLYRITVT